MTIAEMEAALAAAKTVAATDKKSEFELPVQTTAELIAANPFVVGPMSAPTKSIGSFYIENVKLSGSGNHIVVSLVPEGGKANALRLKLLDNAVENIGDYVLGDRFVNPTFAQAVIPGPIGKDGKATWLPMDRKAYQSLSGPKLHIPVYMLGVEQAIPSGVGASVSTGANALKDARAALAKAA